MVCRANANMFRFKVVFKDFSGGPAVKNLSANVAVQSLVREDSICCRATKPVHHY